MISINVILVAALFLCAAVFGGGGSPHPVPELVVQIAAIVVAVLWLWTNGRVWTNRRDRRAGLPGGAVPGYDRPLLILAGLLAALPLVQLIPLPATWWHALPGRDPEIVALAAVGASEKPMPLSMAPSRTLASFLSLVPPLLLLAMVSRLGLRERTALLLAVVAAGALTVLVGAVQLAGGDARWLRFYEVTHYGYLTGFFASRNATVDLLLISALATATWFAVQRRYRPTAGLAVMVAAALVCFLIAALLTGSRAGAMLIPLTALAIAIVLQLRFPIRRRFLVPLVMLGLVAAGTGFALRDNPALQRTWQRFEEGPDARPDLWANTRELIALYWPAGSGVGSFVPVYQAFEPLESVDPSAPNRAHNDYLEFLLEGGVAAALLLVAGFLLIALRLFQAVRSKNEMAVGHAVFSGGALAILALHSLVDYPMRSMALACLGAVAVGIIARSDKVAGTAGGSA